MFQITLPFPLINIPSLSLHNRTHHFSSLFSSSNYQIHVSFPQPNFPSCNYLILLQISNHLHWEVIWPTKTSKCEKKARHFNSENWSVVAWRTEKNENRMEPWSNLILTPSCAVRDGTWRASLSYCGLRLWESGLAILSNAAVNISGMKPSSYLDYLWSRFSGSGNFWDKGQEHFLGLMIHTAKLFSRKVLPTYIPISWVKVCFLSSLHICKHRVLLICANLISEKQLSHCCFTWNFLDQKWGWVFSHAYWPSVFLPLGIAHCILCHSFLRWLQVLGSSFDIFFYQGY